ncbi:MAG: hypothetical protein WCZ28_14055 [Burkholderiaceae bacterium]
MRTGFHGDTLTHRGREFALIDQPLEAYFELIGSRPDFDVGNGRGYAAHWIIEDGWLYLARLAGHWARSDPLSMYHMFPFAGTKVHAAWLCGILRGYRSDRPLPEAPSPVQMRYPDIVLRITDGRLDTASIVHRGAAPATTGMMPAPRMMSAAACARHGAWTEAVV